MRDVGTDCDTLARQCEIFGHRRRWSVTIVACQSFFRLSIGSIAADMKRCVRETFRYNGSERDAGIPTCQTKCALGSVDGGAYPSRDLCFERFFFKGAGSRSRNRSRIPSTHISRRSLRHDEDIFCPPNETVAIFITHFNCRQSVFFTGRRPWRLWPKLAASFPARARRAINLDRQIRPSRRKPVKAGQRLSI